MTAILNFAILNLSILNSAILVFPLKLTHTCQDCFPPFSQNISLIHSDSTWWWQPSWILSCWFQTLPSWIQTPWLSSLRFTQKHSHSTLTLTQTHSFSSNLMMTAILNSAILNLAILNSAILVFPLKLTHTCQDWFPPFPQKKLHSFILTQLDEWQPSWILSCWFQTLPSWIQTPSYLSLSTLSLTQTLTQTN